MRVDSKTSDRANTCEADWEKKLDLLQQETLEEIAVKEKVDLAAAVVRKISIKKYGWVFFFFLVGGGGCGKLFHSPEFVHRYRLKHPYFVMELTTMIYENVLFKNYKACLYNFFLPL